MKTCVLVLAAVLVSSPLAAQSVAVPAGSDLPGVATPKAITGMATSARHCVSSDAANVHQVGWAQTGSRYTITFDTDADLSTAVVRFDLSAEATVVVRGRPDFAGTASSPGMTVLLVRGNGRGGCYRYQVLIDPPAAQVARDASELAVEQRATRRDDARTTAAFERLAISGSPSSGQHCTSGSFVPNVHEIGRVDAAARVFVSFETDFNAIAGATLTHVDAVATPGAFVVQKGGGGSPNVNFEAEAGENVVLYVSGLNGASGCYRYKVEIR